jgi:hypothetical protein
MLLIEAKGRDRTMSRRIVALLGVVALLPACAIHQIIDPIEDETIREVCVVQNKAVREEFLTALTEAIEKHDISTRVVQESEAGNCGYKVTYTARWGWDFTIYLLYADIRVWKGDQKIGESEYDSSAGGIRLDKWVNAEKKVHELVDGLFAP